LNCNAFDLSLNLVISVLLVCLFFGLKWQENLCEEKGKTLVADAVVNQADSSDILDFV
jgi:competence protein ComGC